MIEFTISMEPSIIFYAGGTNSVTFEPTDYYVQGIDLSHDTVDEDHLLLGYTAHNSAGVAITGTYEGGSSAVLVPKTITANGDYDPADDEADGYSSVKVNVQQGLIIPDGMAIYNGYLLPQLPDVEGYNYKWIRKNDLQDTFDAVLGKNAWRSTSTATLDNWRLEFVGMGGNNPAIQFSIPQGSASTDWGEATYSTATVYGTNSHKVIWSSHNMTISTGSNILFQHGDALYPTT